MVELGAERRQDEGAGRVVGREPIEGELEVLHPLAVDARSVGEHAPVVGQGGSHEPFRVPMSAARRAASRRVSRNVASPDLALCGADPDRQIDAHQRIGVIGPFEDCEGLGVVAHGVAGGERSERGIPGPLREVERPGGIRWLGGVPVAGELADAGPWASPQSSSSASATRRCARACRVGPRSS